ncbi:akirin [Anthonomus grandis grandis]|uniref:akirin n=1 Tax=Anthonomus grandis grandis TaxID=2921223 RepID=UPI00216588AA|nr:akirin [Anthonomus grandis grandis]
MACATLKRSLDWDYVLGRPAKRRRCAPFCTSPTQRGERSSSSSPTNSPMCSSSSQPQQPSVFPDVMAQKLTPEYMAESLKAELKRFQKRRQMQHNMMMMENSDSSGNEGCGDMSPSHLDKPVFTFKQVGMICEKMLRERESEIREEYDNVLSTKLAEQYDTFVKFTYDQMQRHYNSQTAPSYLS